MNSTFGFEIKLDHSYELTIEKVTEALKTEGFGVLTKIDVKATLKEKLGREFRPYAILGACNPPLAYQALSSDPAIGLLLPCNVTVEATDDGGSYVRIADPVVMMGVGVEQNPQLVNVAQDARQKLLRVVQALESA